MIKCILEGMFWNKKSIVKLSHPLLVLSPTNFVLIFCKSSRIINTSSLRLSVPGGKCVQKSFINVPAAVVIILLSFDRYSDETDCFRDSIIWIVLLPKRGFIFLREWIIEIRKTDFIPIKKVKCYFHPFCPKSTINLTY